MELRNCDAKAGCVNEVTREVDRESPPRWWLHIAIFVLACLVVIARRPGSVLNPQFYAEDGRVFFQDAYNTGWWASLLRPYGGYFHAVPRLGAALALLVPLSLAPFLLNLIAIAGQALPVNLLLARRSAQWGSLRYRYVLAATYLVLPNLSELGTNITNVQCFLALAGFLLVVSTGPRSVLARVFEVLFLLLFGLSGPYCIFVLPIAIFQTWKHRDRWSFVQASVLAATAAVEAWALLILDHTGRPHYAIGTSFVWLIRILGGQVYLGVLLGTNILASMRGNGMFAFLAAVAVFSTALVAACAISATPPMKLFLFFSCIILGASLVSPMLPARPGFSLWELMAEAWGSHYWFFPNLAFAWTLLWCFTARPAILKVASGFLLFLMTIAIVRDFRQPPLRDLRFQDYARQFEAAPPGEEVHIPINPANWSMWLIKHPGNSR
jgi:hypothetical protein